jgi:glucosamine-6-phosphate deaminase
VLMASGSHKAAAVAAAVEGPVTEACPASIMQLHADATVIVDQDAAAKLTESTGPPAHLQGNRRPATPGAGA